MGKNKHLLKLGSIVYPVLDTASFLYLGYNIDLKILPILNIYKLDKLEIGSSITIIRFLGIV